MKARSIGLLPVLLALAGAAHGASFPIRHMSPDDAVMVLRARLPMMSQACKVTSVSRANDPRSAGLMGVVSIECDPDEKLTEIRDVLAAIDVAQATRRFHVVVLDASRKEGAQPDLPASEIKALNDFKQVMTFKSFQIEAETVLQSDGDAQSQLGGYVLELSINPNTSTGDAIDIRKFQLRSAAPSTLSTGAITYPSYIETSFSIKKGETVVLGTSVAGGAQLARVALVTALP